MKCPYCDGTGKLTLEGTTVGALIMSHRKASGFTQEGLSEAAGFSRAQIANLESGKSDLPIKSLKRIADALGVSAKDLIP